MPADLSFRTRTFAGDGAGVEYGPIHTLVSEIGTALAELQQQNSEGSRGYGIRIGPPGCRYLLSFCIPWPPPPATNSVIPFGLGCPLPSSGTQRW